MEATPESLVRMIGVLGKVIAGFHREVTVVGNEVDRDLASAQATLKEVEQATTEVRDLTRRMLALKAQKEREFELLSGPDPQIPLR